MALICLIGRHGSGKSTLGRHLASAGVKHISLGMLRRLALASEFPSDIPVVLMLALKRAHAAGGIDEALAIKVIKTAQGFPHCVLDGFPSTASHVDLLPADTIFVYVWTPAILRQERLEARSASSKRIWTSGRKSIREDTLPLLVRHIRSSRSLNFIPNRTTDLHPAQILAQIFPRTALA